MTGVMEQRRVGILIEGDSTISKMGYEQKPKSSACVTYPIDSIGAPGPT
jgi:hypothetical protein